MTSPRGVLSETCVFAHYYTWWNPADLGRTALRPARGWYSNQFGEAAITVMREQMRQARKAGLTGFAVEWIGRRSAETGIVTNAFIPANNSLPKAERVQYCLVLDSVIWAMQRHLIKAWYEPIPLSGEHVPDYAEDIAFAARSLAQIDSHFREQYLHIEGRPVVYIYSAHSLGADWRDALELGRQLAGDPLFIIGDFEFCDPLFGRYEDTYRQKATAYDAVTNFSSLNGYPEYATSSIERFLAEGALDAGLKHGADLAGETRSGLCFPGVTTQYFKVVPGASDAAGRDRELVSPRFITDGSVGYLPLAYAVPGESEAKLEQRSRAVLSRLWRTVLATRPRYVFINSWNEPEEGTMIEPSATPNPGGFIMGTAALETLRQAQLEMTEPGNPRAAGDRNTP